MNWLKLIARGLVALLQYFSNKQLLDAGKAKANAETLQDSADREERGREAVAKEQAESAGDDSRALVDRLRRRDGRWGGM